jgi:hypothetical protein
MANYFIGIGGTGARCAEACTYLAAAGLLDSDLHLLIIDPDANNGNASATGNLLTYYYAIHREQQPEHPTFVRRLTKISSLWAKPRDPILFKADINNGGQLPDVWNTQHLNDRRFGDLLAYSSCPPKLKSFLNLFFQPDDLNMELEVGYQGRTNVGSVALKQTLEETQDITGSGFKEFLTRLTADLQNDETKVFIAGSVFGGTGATGIPTIPALLKGLDDRVLPAAQRANLEWGAAFMAPYFIFPRNTSNSNKLGPGTDSARHPLATQAALLYYADAPPLYKHVYLIGAPQRGQTNEANYPGGGEQRNLPHYAELAAALAAWDFFNLPRESEEGTRLHYVDSFDNDDDLVVSWATLPVNLVQPSAKRAELKQKLVAFTTFAYVYRNILHNEFIRSSIYRGSDMYKDNFRNLSLDNQTQRDALTALNSFCDNYLRWLRSVGETGGAGVVSLFNWEAFEASDIRSCEQRVGNLMPSGTPDARRPPRYSTTGYQRIMEKLNQIKLDAPQTQSGVGLFIYLLYEAVSSFCVENYDLR